MRVDRPFRICTYAVAHTCIHVVTCNVDEKNSPLQIFADYRVVSRFTPNCRSLVSQKSSSCTVLYSVQPKRKKKTELCLFLSPIPFLFLSLRRESSISSSCFTPNEDRLFSPSFLPTERPTSPAGRTVRAVMGERDSPNRNSKNDAIAYWTMN